MEEDIPEKILQPSNNENPKKLSVLDPFVHSKTRMELQCLMTNLNKSRYNSCTSCSSRTVYFTNCKLVYLEFFRLNYRWTYSTAAGAVVMHRTGCLLKLLQDKMCTGFVTGMFARLPLATEHILGVTVAPACLVFHEAENFFSGLDGHHVLSLPSKVS